ncbi:MAG: HDOD domain-containing protein [Oligoflexia bacterium]|nr:HDOD domain-containing protein [Oligoflexia bacterium]
MSQTRPGEFEGRIAVGKDWREIVAWVGDLPPMPHVASRAISMVENPETTAAELTEVLQSDTALAARVLKIANSAMFSRQREITTLNQAIMIIGFKALKGIIVAATLRQINKSFGNLEKMIWENSMCTAMCASVVAKKLRRRYVEEIFLLGLLHSLGQIVLLANTATQKDYLRIMNMIRDEQIDYVTAEQEVLGFAHPLIGALVAKKWNFSPETCQVILHYKDPLDSTKPDNELEEKTGVVCLADLISHAAGVGNPEGYPSDLAEISKVATWVGFDPKNAQSDLEAIINETQEQFSREKHVYE